MATLFEFAGKRGYNCGTLAYIERFLQVLREERNHE